MGKQRARLGIEKVERKNDILLSAEKLFLANKADLTKISVDAIVKNADLSKGTFYLYFKTKEEVYLDLLEKLFEEWFDSIKKAFRALKRNPEIEQIVSALITYVLEHEYFIKLLAISTTVIERNINSDRLYTYKIKLQQMIFDLAEIIESRVTTIEIGQGSILLMRSYAILLGTWQVFEYPENMLALFEKEELIFFKTNFPEQLKNSLSSFWKGSTL